MFHLADGCFMNALFLGGGSHVIAPRFEPLAVLRAMADQAVNAVLLVPTMIQLIDHAEIRQVRIDSLRNLLYGASPISEALLDRAMAALPSAGFTQLYGMTALSPAATIPSPEMHRSPGRSTSRHRSAGRAGACAQIRIVDSLGQDVPLGSVGEVAVRAGMMLGHWNKPAQTAAAARDGRMFTGDGGRLDEAGYPFIVDRLKDMIVGGGENVYSAEVEGAIAAHPDVASCAVIRVPDKQRGELVHAVIVQARRCADGRADRRHCKRPLAGNKCPRQVSFVAALPVSGTGKIL